MAVANVTPADVLDQSAEDDLGSMTFRTALAEFLETRKRFIQPRTFRDYQYCSKYLGQFFGHLRPNEITAAHIRRYQQGRAEQCGPHMINHETSLLQQLLKRCGTWERVGLAFQPLPLPKESPGRAITDDEERRLLRACTAHPRWVEVYLFALLSLNTTMGPGEVMSLRRKDIDIDKKTITVSSEGAKNSHRIRTIPLNDIAVRTVKEALEIATKKGSVAPDHYVFPFRKKSNRYDPERRCTTFRTAWEKVLAFAGIENLRQYDLRHTAITRLCEDPNVSEETIEAIAGHITHQMKKRYSHVRVEARRAALAGLVPERLDRAHVPGNGSDDGPRKVGKPLTNQNVLDLVAAGLAAKVIIAKIERAPANYDTEPDTLRALKISGVPDAVIMAMVRAS